MGRDLTPPTPTGKITATMTARRLGAAVKRLRRERGWTQAQLGRRARLSQAHVSEIESGVRANPTARVVQKLARAFGVPVGELLG
jgi:transcriptional regulator with XRE-family HTH domain